MPQNISSLHYFDQGHISLAAAQEIALDWLKAYQYTVTEETHHCGLYGHDKAERLRYKALHEQHGTVEAAFRFLPHSTEEYRLMELFQEAAKATNIMAPKVYDHQKYNGLFSVHVRAWTTLCPLYDCESGVMVRDHKIQQQYSDVLQSIHTLKPFVAQDNTHTDAIVFTLKRVGYWARIAEQKGTCEDTTALLRQYYDFVYSTPEVPMVFGHGHLDPLHIHKTPEGTYTLTYHNSWGYWPSHYDTVFHLWWQIKSLRDTSITTAQVVTLLESWEEVYTRCIPWFVPQYFWTVMTERCIGALLVDIPPLELPSEQEHWQRNIWHGLLQHCITKATEL